MKYSNLLLLVFVLIASRLRGAEGSDYSPESRMSSEIFTSKVLKVYSCGDGDAEYTAYVVNWKDHEVVVMPMGTPAATPSYQVGDKVRCNMMINHKVGDAGKARISFFIAPPLASVRADIEARRLQRAQVETAQPKSP